MKESTREWLKERAAFGTGTRAKEIMDYINEIEANNRTMVTHIAEDIGYPDWEIWDSIAYPTAKDAVMESVMARKA